MKTSKKIMALALTGALAASSVSVVSVSAEPKKATIGVCFYQDTGKAPNAKSDAVTGSPLLHCASSRRWKV